MQKYQNRKDEEMKVIMCGGGTAGHVNPAIAVAQELKSQQPNAKILFIGREGGRENDLVTNAGFEVKTVKIQGLKRSFSPQNVRSVFNALAARRTAKQIIQQFEPDVILGTGGYVCWPVISAGSTLGIPVAIHESNLSAGLTTRLLSKKCDIVLLNRKETKEYLSKRVCTKVVGNPLRQDFSRITKDEARRRIGIKTGEILIVSFGGSIGAEKINETMLEVIKKHSSVKSNVKHIHATGERYFSSLKEKAKKYEKDGCKILPFIHNMPTVLRAADIAVCRSGAMTVSELEEAEVAAILIPSPNVTDDHQLKNAKYLSDKGAAELIEEKNLNAEELKSVLEKLENDENGRKKRAKNIKALSTPDSAKSIVEELILLKKSIN